MIIVYILLGLLLIYLIISFIIFYVTFSKVEVKQIQEQILDSLKDFQSFVDEGMKYFDNISKKDVYIKSFDNLTLHGYFIKNPKAIATMVLVHGYKSNPRNDLSSSIKEYYDRNLNLLVVENRTVGLSEGKYTTLGVLESVDVKFWAMYAKTAYKKPVILGGVSMGATSCLMAAPELQGVVSFVAADCPFVSPYKQIKYTIDHFTILKSGIFMPCVNLFAKFIGKFDMKESVLDNINRCHMPILFIHGKSDSFVPCENTKEAYELYKGKKKLLLVNNASHGMSYYYNKDGYLKALDEFIKKYIK